jgi:uncharacterized protein (DUF1501 family)
MSDDPRDFDPPRGFGEATRRQAMQALGVGTAAGAPFLASLAAAGNAAAQTASDYKALVVLLQAGGNDHANTVIPRSGEAYAAYQRGRTGLALPQNTLLPITPTGFSGPDLALSPQLPGIRTLFEQGKAAVVANVGPLVEPVTRREYEAKSKRLPFQLFSHSDQQRAWETCYPDAGSRSGWLGRLGDAVEGVFNAGSRVSICMSLAGNNVILSGERTQQFQLNRQGPVRIQARNDLYGSTVAAEVMRQLITENRWHILETTYNAITSRAILTGDVVATALSTQGAPLAQRFPESDLGAACAMIAQLIRVRQTMGQRRQIFFLQTNGWDFHDDLLADQAPRLSNVDASLSALYAATVEMGVSNSVTMFTVSDFGRALQSNGRGTDHGWGGHHLVIGGAVQGRRIYGSWPTIALGSAEDAGQGRLIPTTAIDQYVATLARWFGADASTLGVIAPNLSRFSTSNLGFLG